MGAEGGFCLRLDSPRTAAGRNLAAHVPVTLGPSHALRTATATASPAWTWGAYEFNPYRFEPALELTHDGLVFRVRGEPGKSVRVERSRDLDWGPMGTSHPGDTGLSQRGLRPALSF